MHLFTKLKTNFWILSQNVEKCFPLKGARDEADEPRRKPWESTSAAGWPWIKPGENNEDNVESTKNVFSANPWFRPEPDGRVWRAGERDFEEAGACRILPGHGQRQVDLIFILVLLFSLSNSLSSSGGKTGCPRPRKTILSTLARANSFQTGRTPGENCFE